MNVHEKIIETAPGLKQAGFFYWKNHSFLVHTKFSRNWYPSYSQNTISCLILLVRIFTEKSLNYSVQYSLKYLIGIFLLIAWHHWKSWRGPNFNLKDGTIPLSSNICLSVMIIILQDSPKYVAQNVDTWSSEKGEGLWSSEKLEA